MSKPKPPPSPPWEEMLALQQQQMQMNNAISQEFLGIFREQTASQEARLDEYWEMQRPMMEEALASMREHRHRSNEQYRRYEELGIPIEDELADDLMNWGSEDRTRAREAEAVADVSQAFAGERSSIMANLAGMGVDPSQVAATSLASRHGAQAAAAKASAATGARRQSEQEGLAMKGDAANLYRGIEASGAQQAQLGFQAQQAGVPGAQAGLQAGANLMQGSSQGFGTASNMVTSGGNMMSNAFNTANNIYGNQLGAWQTQFDHAAGMWGGLLGTGLGLMFNEGGYVAPEMSPSRGAIPDDVPARLTGGEAVLPPETVMYHGLKTINKLNQETERAMQEGAARGQGQRPYRGGVKGALPV